MRIVLGVEYDGSKFCGWQSQPEGCGVQDALESAIEEVAGQGVRIHAAGRTDTGVHALLQVIHFDTEVFRPDNAWVRGVNAFLPETVRVIWSRALENDDSQDAFHARFSARKRSYQYCLINSSVAPAVLATKVGWYHLPLMVPEMQEAATYLIGEHDFNAFRASNCQAKSSIKNLYEASILQKDNRLVFNFSANAFLHHQVRNMVGALIYIGNGKYPPEFIKQLLLNKDRTLSPPTFSAHGLYLIGVDYDEKWNLPLLKRQVSLI